MTNNTNPAGLSSSEQQSRGIADRDSTTDLVSADEPKTITLNISGTDYDVPAPVAAWALAAHMGAPHPPTREQIADRLEGLQLWTGVSSAPLVLDKALSAQIAYALIQNGAER